MKRSVAAISLLIVACTPTPEPVTPPAVDTVVAPIEPSVTEEPEVVLGAGDEEAERCFAKAAAGDEQRAELVSRCRGGELEVCNDVTAHLERDQPSCEAKVREVACEAGHAKSCAALAKQLMSQPGPPATRIKKLLESACEGGVAESCTELGRREQALSGRRTPQASVHYERGCNLGDPPACMLACDNASNARCERVLERGCDLGDEKACLRLGMALLLGVTPRGLGGSGKGQLMLDTLCLATTPTAGEACWVLALHTAARKGHYATRACDNGHYNACVHLLGKHRDAGRFPEAVALADKLNKTRPEQWFPYWVRASILFNTGRHADSLPSFVSLIPLRPDWPLMHILLYAARERAGQKGKKALEQAFATMDATTWPGPVFSFMLGKSSRAKLLAATKDPNAFKQRQQECEAFYYIGQQMLIRGQKAAAKQMFEKSVATNVKDYIEYAGSKAELTLLSP